MRAAWGTGAVLVALALAGCGAEDVADEARDAVDPMAEAAERTIAAGGARIDGVIRYDFDGVRADATLTGAVDFEEERSRVRLEMPGLGAAAAREVDLPHQEIRDGLTIYTSTPSLRRRLGVGWAKVDVESILEGAADAADVDIDAEALVGWNESNPADLLRFMKVAGDARPVGERRVGGETVTRYEATVDLHRYAELVVPDDEDAAFRARVLAGIRNTLGQDRVPVEVDVDRDGRIRRERFVVKLTVNGSAVEAQVRMRFEDFGEHHRVDLPDDADVRDVTDRLDEFKTEIVG